MISSCAKINYLVEQGVGQVKLLTKAKSNSFYLNDVKTSKKIKNKIRLINKYKNYFYTYWKKTPTEIYSKTTILENDAVTYLVIASKFNEIKAKKECFPLMGCFPYLGFFKKKSAQEYSEKMEREGFDTYMRPVYAYSTLTYFTDPILSSFFQYDEYDLAELVFHELFHTIFFVKDEVDFNENMANYFGKEMAKEYFANKKENYRERKKSDEKSRKLTLYIVAIIKKLEKLFINKNFQDRPRAKIFFSKFMDSTFYPQITKKCEELEYKNCYALKKKWNNAKFAALLTYEKEIDNLGVLRKKLGADLKKLLFYILSKQKLSESNDSPLEKLLFTDIKP